MSKTQTSFDQLIFDAGEVLVNDKLTRAGVNYILLKYVDMASKRVMFICHIRCHVRHSKAMHLCKLALILFTSEIFSSCVRQTTNIYARAYSRAKIDAIEKAYIPVMPEKAPVWMSNDNPLDWLKRF